jgi:hypothetical protein
MPRPLRRLAGALALLLLGSALSGCIIEEEHGHGHGWCWWHPYACR